MAGIGAFIVDRHFVFQCVEIGARKAFNKVHVTRVRQAATDEPELLIVAHGIDD